MAEKTAWEKEQEEQQRKKAAIANQSAQQSAAQGTTRQQGLKGLSDPTRDNLNKYGQGYTPGDAVTKANNYLQNVINGKPADYESQYKGQVEKLYNDLVNRGPFEYDLNGDQLFQQYKNIYTQQGKKAMRDTMGQAAGLTGGYGNSYAAAAGNQAYNEYLQKLGYAIPELYQQAYNQYTQEGDDLLNKLKTAQGLDDTAYGRYRDLLGDWQNERSFASDREQQAYNRDYADWSTMLEYWQNQAGRENTDYWRGQEYDLSAGQAGDARRESAYNQVLSMLQSGMNPSDALLNQAGMTQADVDAFKAWLLSQRTGGGGGRGRTQREEKPDAKESSVMTPAERARYKAYEEKIKNNTVESEGDGLTAWRKGTNTSTNAAAKDKNNTKLLDIRDGASATKPGTKKQQEDEDKQKLSWIQSFLKK